MGMYENLKQQNRTNKMKQAKGPKWNDHNEQSKTKQVKQAKPLKWLKQNNQNKMNLL